MRFVVYGAGAIGGVIGGRLVEHGHDVALIARGAHYEAIRDHGLTIESPDGTVTVEVEAVGHPSKLGFTDADIVILATKSQDTLAALTALAGATAPTTPVVCAQNGVENERVALRWFANVYGMCVMCPAAHLVPGVVQAYSSPTPGILHVGRFPVGIDDVAEHIAAALRDATFASEARPDIMRWKYTKLLMNLANAAEAAFAPSDARNAVGTRVREEGAQVLRAAGIAFATNDEDAALRGDTLRIRPIGSERRGGGSSWQSLERRTGSVESDYLNGEIVALARLHGVPAPVNEALARLCVDMARDRAAPQSRSAADLLTALGSEPSATTR
jgi:2-dehydropantoate 2-reductase